MKSSTKIRKYWYIYQNAHNVGFTGSKHVAFQMVEKLAGRVWTKLEDHASSDLITIKTDEGLFEAKREVLK